MYGFYEDYVQYRGHHSEEDLTGMFSFASTFLLFSIFKGFAAFLNILHPLQNVDLILDSALPSNLQYI